MLKILLLLSLLIGCGQSHNSNTGDDKASGNLGIDTSNPSGVRLAAAYSVVVNRCVNCHTGYHNSWGNLTTDAAWIASGAVVAGNPNGSSLVYRLKNVGGDMPKLNPQIPDTEYQALLTWINAL